MPVAHLERFASAYLERSASETARLPCSELLLLLMLRPGTRGRKNGKISPLCLKPICIGKPGRRFSEQQLQQRNDAR